MANETKDFFGKDVAEAIKEACTVLKVAQENLNIEVLETGSKGIFGLIRRNAHIRVSVQDPEEDSAQKSRPKKAPAKSKAKQKKPDSGDGPEKSKPEPEPAKPAPQASPEPAAESAAEPAAEQPEPQDFSNDQPDNGRGRKDPLPEETLAVAKSELEALLARMDCPSSVTVEDAGGTAHCNVSDQYQEILTSQDGKVLDSLQYLLRKIVAKKTESRVQLTIDVGNYREQRYDELRQRAVELADLVKADGKTQVIASLNPSERRTVHMALQDDADIRSRSVGDGLFKKVLIYKPGKGRKSGGRRRGRSNNRRKNNSTQKREAS